MKKLLVTLFIIMAGIASVHAKKIKQTMVKIETEYGNIVVKLYDETPLHKENFLKLVKEGFYNDLLFHRVIKDFMIQGGDPESKGAPAGKSLGAGDVGYDVVSSCSHGVLELSGTGLLTLSTTTRRVLWQLLARVTKSTQRRSLRDVSSTLFKVRSTTPQNLFRWRR